MLDQGIKVLAAAHSVLTRAGDGSSPSGPTPFGGPLKSGRTRVATLRTHDVADAYRLAMAEVRVQLPLGACISYAVDLDAVESVLVRAGDC